jgi:hypothetical protein
MTKLVRLTAQYFSPGGLLNAGELVGLPDALAAQLVAASAAVLVDDGAGSGVPIASPFRGQIASETNAQFVAAGGDPGNENPSAAIQGSQGDVTIMRNRSAKQPSVKNGIGPLVRRRPKSDCDPMARMRKQRTFPPTA